MENYLEKGIQIPQPEDIPKRERDDAMGAYLMMFAAWAIGLPLPSINLIAGFIYHFVNRKKSRFVAFHSFQSLITQTILTLFNASLLAYAIHILYSPSLNFSDIQTSCWAYFGFVIVLNLIYTIFSLIAMNYARKGNFYYFWVFGRLSFARYYGPNAVNLEKSESPNRPPEGF